MAAASSRRSEIARDFVGAVMRLAPRHKHPKFSEEKEWRLIVGEVDLKAMHVRPSLRAGRLSPIPYVALPFSGVGVKLTLREVVIGPTNEPEMCREALDDHIHWSGRSKLSVAFRTSEIPYRLL